MSIASIRALRVLMPLSAASAISSQALAIFTNYWLYTEEFMPNESYEKFETPPSMEYHRKYTSSGLWVLCHNDPPGIEMRCANIDYFSNEEYIPDQNDSTMAIPYSVKRAAVYILLSSVVLFLGEAIYLCRKLCGHRQICTFITGITFILAGLTILAGLVVYISTFKGEVSNKLRPLSEFQEALFHYRYGFSFLMLVASLILCEISGTLSIFLYIAQKQFQITIDAEREEVLKKNILNLLATKPSNGAGGLFTEQPMLRIVCEDEHGIVLPNPDYPTTSTAIDHNFLSADFGLEPAFYFCGRHGTRGRRNSRSNESYLGSSRESAESRSRKNSFTSMQDEPSFHSSLYHHSGSKDSDKQNKLIEDALCELHVPSPSQLHPFREAPEPNLAKQKRASIVKLPFTISKIPSGRSATKALECVSEGQEMAMPYILPIPTPQTMRAQTNMNTDQVRNRLTKQTSLESNPNRSTFV